ncbi:hypothetical protein RB195_011489 [Necator americanus]|uniref:Uncharacterized protein n=1 Tax=Necator americanus TaxID=51031 RepID=A0ABR1D2L8_NECAM
MAKKQRATTTFNFRVTEKSFRVERVPEKFVALLDGMNQQGTAAVRTPGECTTWFEVVTEVRQGAVARPSLFSLAIREILSLTTVCSSLGGSRVDRRSSNIRRKQRKAPTFCQPCIEASSNM